MSNKFTSINRMMRSQHELERKQKFERLRLKAMRDDIIDDALDRMEEDEEYQDVKDGAIVAFEEMLEEELQAKHDTKYHNGEREDTYIAFIHLGSIRRRDESVVHLYGTVVEGARRITKGKERNKRDENGLKNKFTTTVDDG